MVSPCGALLPLDRDVPADAAIELGEHALDALPRRCLVVFRAGGPLHESLGLPHRLLLDGAAVPQEQAGQRDPAAGLDVPLLATLVIDSRRQDGRMGQNDRGDPLAAYSSRSLISAFDISTASKASPWMIQEPSRPARPRRPGCRTRALHPAGDQLLPQPLQLGPRWRPDELKVGGVSRTPGPQRHAGARRPARRVSRGQSTRSGPGAARRSGIARRARLS